MDGGASRARWPPSGCRGAARVPGRNTVRRHARRGGQTSGDVPVVRRGAARRAAIRRGRGGNPSSGATAPLDDRMAPPRALASRRRIRRRARGARGGRPATSRRDQAAAAHEPGARGRAGRGARAALPVAWNITADGAPADRGATGGRRLPALKSAAAPPPKLDLQAQSIAIPVTEPFGPTGLEVRIRDETGTRELLQRFTAPTRDGAVVAQLPAGWLTLGGRWDVEVRSPGSETQPARHFTVDVPRRLRD